MSIARMVDIGEKATVRREAVASGSIFLKRATIAAVRNGCVKKGDVITASKLAGIQAAKATSSILPLCHQVPLTHVKIDVLVKESRIEMRCSVSATYKTGVEMEALVGVTTALLNAWDMVKYLEKDSKGQYPMTRISDVKIMSKVKGERDNGN